MSKNHYRRFDSHDTEIKSEEKIINNTNEVSLPEDNDQVTVEKETEDVKPSVNFESVRSVDGRVNVLSNMRSTPEITDSNILCVVPADSSILIYGNTGDFYKVKYNGQFGYIKRDLIV